MATADTRESLAAPSFDGAHRSKDLFLLSLHPLGQSMFIFAHIVGDAHHRHAKPASIAVDRIEVEKVAGVRKRVRLNADDPVVLPVANVILVRLTPPAHIRRNSFPADLNR